MERRTGIEPATFSLARRRSTTELPPQCEGILPDDQKIINALCLVQSIVKGASFRDAPLKTMPSSCLLVLVHAPNEYLSDFLLGTDCEQLLA